MEGDVRLSIPKKANAYKNSIGLSHKTHIICLVRQTQLAFGGFIYILSAALLHSGLLTMLAASFVLKKFLVSLFNINLFRSMWLTWSFKRWTEREPVNGSPKWC